jgi:hypothetical protein
MSVIEVIQPVCWPRVDQRRHVQARVEVGAVLALDLDLDAAGRAAPLQFLLEDAHVLVHPVAGPVGEGRQGVQQVGFE